MTVILTGCFNNWTAEDRKKFEAECLLTETFNNVVFLFRGFDNNEFDSITVKEYKDSVLLDSFKVFVRPAQSPTDKEIKERRVTIDRPMNVKYRYHFIVPGQRPYELVDMKMVMWAQYTMTSEGWGCEMADYTIDGEKFEDRPNPTFLKRDAVHVN